MPTVKEENDIVERLRTSASDIDKMAWVVERSGNEFHAATLRQQATLEAEAAFLIEQLRTRIGELERDRDMWNADSVRLSSGLVAINTAHETVPASVLRSVAYDIALNCIPRDVAEFQIAERTRSLLGDTQ